MTHTRDNRSKEKEAGAKDDDDHQEKISYAKVVILGASGVGKTSIIKLTKTLQLQRFAVNKFSGEHVPTIRKYEYFPNLVYDCSIVECRVVDLPTISVFPATSDEEWLNYPNFGLRTADAFLLVYDATNPASFSYVQLMREQIMMSRGLADLPLLVLANKMDLLSHPDTSDRGKLRQDIANKVKKSWKLSHIEVSAKYNWNITRSFRELSSQLVSVQSRLNSLGGHHANNEDTQTCCLVCV